MNIARFWRLLWISGLTFLLAACKPSPDFSVSPTPVVAGIPATFDASTTTIYNTHKGNTAVSYSWDFGDGNTGSGQVVGHTYTAPGTYSVKLKVKDKAGQTGTITEQVVVLQGDASLTTLTVVIQGADGATVQGARVQVGEVTTQTNALGLATLALAQSGTEQLVMVSKSGYVTQSLRTSLAPGSTSELLIALLPVKETQSTQQIEAARMFIAKTLGATVTLPANALVNTAGETASGTATLQLTPWDIMSDDLRAMPANGQALDAQGNRVSLISAGMMTVDFFDATGAKLQLAKGKTADIQMDLPLASINNQALSVGSQIPLWHFDEAQGLWIEEGVGMVVASNTSPVGLAVKATVSHFSTWNWDYVYSGAGTVNVRCLGADDLPANCNVMLVAKRADGSRAIRWLAVPSDGVDVPNIPADVTIDWEATAADGSRGTTTSGNSGNVVIQLELPSSSNSVQCTLANGTATACDVKLTITRTNGNIETKSFFVAAGGSEILTFGTSVASLEWNATSLKGADESGALVAWTGSTTSGTSGVVSLALTTKTVLPSKTVFLRCDSTATFDPDGSSPTTVAVASCNASAFGYGFIGGVYRNFSYTIHAPSGTLIPIALPTGYDTLYVSASGDATTVTGMPLFSIFPGWQDGNTMPAGTVINLSFQGGLVLM